MKTNLKPTIGRTWIFSWQGYGFNTVVAASREEALEKANRMGRGGLPRLVVDELTLRLAGPRDRATWNGQYAEAGA